MKKYAICRTGWLDYFTVKVYSNVKHMRIGITRDGGTPDGSCIALVQPAVSMTNPRHIGEFTSNMFATMYLNEDHMGRDILVHECLHVALAHERFVERFRMYYGLECGAQEERLAYYLSEIYVELTRRLRK